MPVDDTELPDPPAIGSATTRPAADADTVAQLDPIAPQKGAGDETYDAGTILGGRYRVVGLIGRGGMGEVYRAHDLVLHEDVAVKFLPRALDRSEVYLERFLAEVRIARQVTHPNVCRVHDIGEADGRRFLSMEYIDGEDLQSLLRRIGRLPQEKTVELAHALCHGLHALHERGILHRDLKPSNVMLDGRGRAKLADFGLAVVAEHVGAHEIGDGTPAYMAPEQARGEAVSVRSDVYALGLVLFELFTGKHALAQGDGASARPVLSQHVSDVDPAIQLVIERCLDPDPEARPSSALAVAAALPGGDPIAAAMAAGETLSPDLLLQAGRSDGIGRVWASAALACVALVLVVMAWLAPDTTALGVTSPPFPPDVLVQRAREAIAAAGHEAQAVDRHYTLAYDTEYLFWLRTPAASEVPSAAASADGPPGIVLDYREHPSPLVAKGSGVTMSDPPLLSPDAVYVQVDGRGRLRRLTVVPPQQLETGAAPDFTNLIEHAGFAPETLEAIEPRTTPSVWADHRVAWMATFPERPDIPVRIEAAAAGGRVVSFAVFAPWSPQWSPQTPQEHASSPDPGVLGILLNLGVGGLLLIGGALLAHRTLTRHRSDMVGAARIGLIVGALTFIGALIGGHLPIGEGWVVGVRSAAREAAMIGLLAWVGYVIVEPHARRVWPRTMVSWIRVMRGQSRDPRIGGDVLVGAAMGGLFIFLQRIREMLPEGSHVNVWGNLDVLCGPVRLLGALGTVAGASLGLALLVYVWMLLLRLLSRRDWAAAVLFVLVRASLVGSQAGFDYPVFDLTESVLLAFVILRLGLLAMVVTQFVAIVYASFPLSIDLQPWWASTGLLVPIIVGGLAVFGYRKTVRQADVSRPRRNA
jgi:tRNA A-37 threonylcarbamoyl transferase component Bud32